MSNQYSENLKNGNWQKRRVDILQRDNFKCTVCGSNEFLDIHHVDYITGTRAWEYPNDMLKTLCRKCHEKEQPRFKVERYLMDSLKMKGFMVGDLLALSTMVDTEKEFTEKLLKTLRDFQR